MLTDAALVADIVLPWPPRLATFHRLEEIVLVWSSGDTEGTTVLMWLEG